MRHSKTILFILAVTAGIFLLSPRFATVQRNVPEVLGLPADPVQTSEVSSPSTDPVVSVKIGLLTPVAQSNVVWTSRTPAAKRVSEIYPDVSWMTSDPVLKAGDLITLALFKDTVLDAEISNVTRYPNGAVGITAHLQDGREGTLFLAYSDGQMRASVQVMGGPSFYVKYNPETHTHYALEVDRAGSVILEGAEPRIPPLNRGAPADAPVPLTASEPVALADAPAGSTIVDVMIVYTPAALAYEGSLANMNNNIAMAMQKAKEAHTNSNTQVYLNLVHSAQVNYTEVDADTDLDNLTYSNGIYSAMDEVHSLRNQYGADFICLFESTSEVGGMGWLLSSTSGQPDRAFCLARVQQSDWTYTVVHEWGHNMGCSHSKTQVVQPWTGKLYSYSAGWQWSDTKASASIGYCSIMTYEDANDDGIQDYERVGYFSNPSISYTGNSTNPTGNATNGDNARTIREMKTVLAGYRTAVVSPAVTLSLTGSPMAEAGGTATVKATLSGTYTQPVTVNLAFSGTATQNTDYTPSGTAIVIPAGSLTNSITLTAVQDTLYEGNETIIVDVSTVVNGTESGTQQVTATIADDDPQLVVSPSTSATFTGSSGGFTTPSNQVYTLNNAGSDTISWTASSTNSWLVLSATGGTLMPGATTNVTLNVNSSALAVGDYAGTITFSDTTHGNGQSCSVILTVTPLYIYFFPLDTDPGWGRTGQWEFGRPTGQGGAIGSPDPTSGATGTNVFGVNLNGDYLDVIGGPYYLTAGPFDFSTYTNVHLYFERWLNTDYRLATPATVELSTNGATWVQVYISNGYPGNVSTNWTSCEYSIPSADRQGMVYVRWGYAVLDTNWNHAASGWNIDDIGFTGDAIVAPDMDSDGIPNEWELQYFGGPTNANPSATAANGVNTVLQAYIAGLDPTNPASFFTASLSNAAGFVVSWNVVSGRVYGVYCATNLLNGFQPLETNILFPQSSYTDTVHSTEGNGFYKIDVQLAP